MDSEHEDYADFDFDSIMADDKYSDFYFDGYMTIFYSDSSDVEDDMDEGCHKDYEPDSDSDSDSENSGSDDETPTLLTAVPPKVLEPYHHIEKIQRFTTTAIPKGYRICGDNIDKTVQPRFARSGKKNLSLHYFHFFAVQN